MSTRHFQKVRGFDEVFSGYGGEDLDFYWRLSRMGAQRLLCEPTDVIRAIEHGPQLRSVHYEVKDIRRSFLQARAYRLVKETYSDWSSRRSCRSRSAGESGLMSPLH